MIRFDNIILATATYDKANNIVYATVNGGPVSFSKDDYVVLTVSGSSVLAQVEALETSGDWATIIQLDIDHNWLNSFFNSGSEQQVLIRVLSRSKSLVIPFATIDLPAVPTPAALLELKQKIASTNRLDFLEAAAILGLNTSSKAPVTFNAGNPKKMVDTFVADKVKAIFSKKGMDLLSPAKTKGQIFTDSGSVQERFDDYLKEMREVLVLLSRDEQQFVQLQQFVHYTLSVIDKESKVILNNKQIKNVCVFKKDGNKEYRIQFNENFDQLMALSGNYTIIIERETVERLDFLAWYGETWKAAFLDQWPIWSDQVPDDVFNDVTYSKIYGPGLLELVFDLLFPDWAFSFIGELVTASFTVDKKTIYGVIELGEDNNVKFTKPNEMGLLAWAKDLAALKSNGKGVLAQVKKGSLAKEDTLQLKVDLGNFLNALDVFKGIQAIPTATFGELSPLLGMLKVTGVEISLAKAEVKVVTAITTLALGTVKWFDNSLEILLPINSKETFNVVNSNRGERDDGLFSFQDVHIEIFLDAALADIKTNYVRELRDVLNSSDTDDQGDVTWMMTVTSGGERLQAALYNAEVIQTTSVTKYRFLFYDDQVIRLPLDFLSDYVQVTFNRTELVTI